jgi:uncharacterized membrane protein
MKKLLMFVVLVVTLTACSQEYNDTELDRDASVPVGMQDSTEWRTVQLYESKNGETIYIKEKDHEIHKIDVINPGPTAFIIFILIVWAIISLFIIAHAYD